MYRTILVLGAALLLALPSGCKNKTTALNEANPYYQKGLQLREQGKYEEAVQSFKTCLYYSPDSYKAHAQMGIVYEDHLRDYPNAIVQYQEFQKRCPADDADAEKVAQWQERAKQSYYEQLRERYGAKDAAPANKTGGSPAPATRIPKGAEPAAATAEGAEAPRKTYVVKSGDTLQTISRQQYGSSKHWRLIYDANRDKIKSPERLEIGQELLIPPPPSPAAPLPPDTEPNGPGS